MSGNIPRSHTVMIFWDGWWVCLPSWGELHVTLANTEITQVSQVYTLPETNSQSTWKSAIPKGKFIIFQSSIFRGELAGFVSGRVLEMGVSKNRGGTRYPQIIHFNRPGFPLFSPSILGVYPPLFLETPKLFHMKPLHGMIWHWMDVSQDETSKLVGDFLLGWLPSNYNVSTGEVKYIDHFSVIHYPPWIFLRSYKLQTGCAWEIQTNQDMKFRDSQTDSLIRHFKSR